jgi:multisubunit Na+/H+ antiporter MnhE subunit
MRWVVAVLALTGIYLLMLISLDPWDIAIGLIISTALVLVFRGPLGLRAATAGPSPVRRMRALPVFVAHTIWDVLSGAVRVALMVLQLQPLANRHFIEIPFDDDTPAGVALNALLTTLSPGSVLIDVDWERRVALYHVLDDAEPAEIRRKYRELYERYQRHVLP